MSSFHQLPFVSRKIIGIYAIITVILFLSIPATAQNFQGRIFNNDTPLEGVIITNTTRQLTVYSEREGYFEVEASQGDTILFRSNFYTGKTLVISKEHLLKPQVIELYSNDIDLEEVVVSKELQPNKFEAITYSKDLNVIIQEDIKKHPEKYAPAAANYGVNFVAIIRTLARIFKRREKDIQKTEKYLSADDLDSLILHHDLINRELLVNQLHIEPEHHPLFFQFLEMQNIPFSLLKRENKLELLDLILMKGKLFKSFLELATTGE